MRKVTKLLLYLMVGVVLFSSCNPVENSSTSSTRLYVKTITGKDIKGNPGSTVIYSDVITGGSVINDVVSITVFANLLDPNATPTAYQNVIIDQIDVEYSRADGLSVQGKDVPRSFSVKTNQLVLVSSPETIFSMEIIQHTAKLESPLVELINGGGAGFLKLEAKITIHSKDTAGKRLAPTVTSVSVRCANFADPEGSSSSGS